MAASSLSRTVRSSRGHGRWRSMGVVVVVVAAAAVAAQLSPVVSLSASASSHAAQCGGTVRGSSGDRKSSISMAAAAAAAGRLSERATATSVGANNPLNWSAVHTVWWARGGGYGAVVEVARLWQWGATEAHFYPQAGPLSGRPGGHLRAHRVNSRVYPALFHGVPPMAVMFSR